MRVLLADDLDGVLPRLDQRQEQRRLHRAAGHTLKKRIAVAVV